MIVYSKTSNTVIEPYAVCLGKTISKNSLRKLGNYNSMARYIPKRIENRKSNGALCANGWKLWL